MSLRFERKLGTLRGERKGFTLIELLVVIAIIGILAAVVLVSLNTARVRGRDARRLSDLQNVSLAMELFSDVNDGQYPDDALTPCAGDAEGTGTPTDTLFGNIATCLSGEGYLADVPSDPLGTRAYVGVVSTGLDSYILGADLEADNQACDADYDGVDFAGGATCDEDGGAGVCDGEETADAIDYCMCQGPDCA